MASALVVRTGTAALCQLRCSGRAFGHSSCVHSGVYRLPNVYQAHVLGPVIHRRFVVAGAVDETAAAAVAPPAPKPVYNVRRITKDDVEISFARSSGAGGQNVNKVNTKVDMRFEVSKAGWIPDEVKDAMRQLEKNRFTSEGFLVMQSQRHRTQSQNLDDALAKIQEIIDRAVEYVTPKEADPETIKRVKAQIKAGKEKRLDGKKKDSVRKKERSRRDWD